MLTCVSEYTWLLGNIEINSKSTGNEITLDCFPRLEMLAVKNTAKNIVRMVHGLLISSDLSFPLHVQIKCVP